MPNIKPVTTNDCGKLEGDTDKVFPLHSAIKEICPGATGDALWERISKKYGLGFVDCDSWVTNMNFAISTWNQNSPTDCQSVIAAFDV